MHARLSLLTVVAICDVLGGASAQVTFTTASRGQQSAIEEHREVVVRTATEWVALWKAHAPGETPPAVDFTQSMVVGLFLGLRSTAGFDVEITAVQREGDGLIVVWRERQPAREDTVAQVLTYPFHLVRTARQAGPVRFQRTQ